MSGNIIWKCVLSAMVLAWSVLNLIPWHDTPFADYVAAHATAHVEEFNALLVRAADQVEEGVEPTVFVALRHIINEDRIDLLSFFPDINVSDIRNLEKRNYVLLRELLRRSQSNLKLGLDLKGGVAFTFKVSEEDLSPEAWERAQQLSQAETIIASRIDGMGVAEPIIRKKGDARIEVLMPGISTRDNPDAIESLQAPALLEFSTVHRTVRPPQEAPLGYVAMTEEREDRKTGQLYKVSFYVKKLPDMTGEIIKRAYPGPNDAGGYWVYLNFTDDGSRQFADVTRRIAEENDQTGTLGQMAIILDGKLFSAPTVRQEIRGDSAVIEGRFSQREAMELANVLNNPLEVGLEIEEMYEVGPSLAKDARQASLKAAVIGAVLIILFMVLYYQSAGLVAVVAILFDIIIVVGVLANFNATLTLPGVAALVLTIGMAVDANILIFERIREELKLGKNLHNALISGFDKAFSTIVDANVTTLITACILIWLGTGPVKGFGVTLAVGILASMFCALVVTRWILELLVISGLSKKLIALNIFKLTDTPFLDFSKPAFIASWCIVFIGALSFTAHFDHIFGIDFLGGDEITVTFEQKLTSEEIVHVSEQYDFGEVHPLYQNRIGQSLEILTIQTEEGRGAEFFNALLEKYPTAGLELAGETRIGSSVGDDVKWSAFLSISVALLGLLLFVAVRFEFGYGIGAVVATVHDILMTVGVYIFLGKFLGIGSGQFSAPMIASILMIVGYSINDTIVVFDRIREELTLNPGLNLRKVVNLAINRTLARTILTSLTTMLATLSLYLFGAGVVVDFSLVFLIGIITGTFSSIFIASPVFFWYHKGDRKKVQEGHILPHYEWDTSKKAVR